MTASAFRLPFCTKQQNQSRCPVVLELLVHPTVQTLEQPVMSIRALNAMHVRGLHAQD